MADDVLILIPARMASTRLPGKPLADIAGLPMIVQVLRRARGGQGRFRWWSPPTTKPSRRLWKRPAAVRS